MIANSLSKQHVLAEAVRHGLVGEGQPLAGFIDVDGVRASAADLHSAFAKAPQVLHAFAAKANPLVPVLTLARECGLGCEVASPGEMAVACAAGFAPDHVVLDSPAKTQQELSRALALGVAVNLDNLQEIDRVRSILSGEPTTSIIGLRVNPQVGAGSIDATSTATTHSKFGVAMRDGHARQLIMEVFGANLWLTRLHAHVGSQGCPLGLIADGIAAVHSLAQDINKTLGRRQVTSLDIGGGLPVNFEDEEIRPTFGDYVAQLEITVPEIFDGEYSLVTEFGRSLLAKNGFIASTVEYTKDAGGRRIALTHAGGQVATRTVYMPEAWPIRVTAHDSKGILKDGSPFPQDIGGPLCFAGDVVAHNRPLPELEPGDFVVLHDTGAYYFTSPWYYNSLPLPPVYGFATASDGTVQFSLIRRAQSLDEVVALNGGALKNALVDGFGEAGDSSLPGSLNL